MGDVMIITTIFIWLVSYLLGSIPFGLILCKAFGYGDIRAIGSGNIGATNVLRTGNKPLALATFLLDTFKGAAAVGIAILVYNYTWFTWGAGLCAIIGHVYPVWLKFKGGKGVGLELACGGDCLHCLAGHGVAVSHFVIGGFVCFSGHARAFLYVCG